MAYGPIEEVVHRLDGRVGDQAQGGLVEIDAVPQCWVYAAVDQR